MIEKEILKKLYVKNNKSLQDIADTLGCSVSGVRYWMNRHGIMTRTRSEAVYLKHNPKGDPFRFRYPKVVQVAKLYGAGLGIYWGEGTKADKGSVRVGNTDPELIKTFISFLEKIYGIDRGRLRFGLQIFSDMDTERGLDFWQKTLKMKRSQFYKVIVTPCRSIGTYRTKTKNGVLTVYFHNKKLRDLLVKQLETEFRYLVK